MLEEVLNGGFGFEDNDMWTPLKSLINSLVAFSKAGGDPPLLPLDDVEVSRLFFACCDDMVFAAAAAIADDGGGGGGTGGKPKDSTGLVVIFLAGIFKMPFNCLGPLVNWTTCLDVSLGMAMILGPNITFDNLVCKGQDDWPPAPEVTEFILLDLIRFEEATAAAVAPLLVTSWQRPPAVSSRLKMASKSESVAEAMESGLQLIKGWGKVALPKGSI